MKNVYPTWPGSEGGNENDHDHRLLRKLKFALLFWFVSFLLTLLWFSYSPTF